MMRNYERYGVESEGSGIMLVFRVVIYLFLWYIFLNMCLVFVTLYCKVKVKHDIISQ